MSTEVERKIRTLEQQKRKDSEEKKKLRMQIEQLKTSLEEKNNEVSVEKENITDSNLEAAGYQPNTFHIDTEDTLIGNNALQDVSSKSGSISQPGEIPSNLNTSQSGGIQNSNQVSQSGDISSTMSIPQSGHTQSVYQPQDQIQEITSHSGTFSQSGVESDIFKGLLDHGNGLFSLSKQLTTWFKQEILREGRIPSLQLETHMKIGRKNIH